MAAAKNCCPVMPRYFFALRLRARAACRLSNLTALRLADLVAVLMFVAPILPDWDVKARFKGTRLLP